MNTVKFHHIRQIYKVLPTLALLFFSVYTFAADTEAEEIEWDALVPADFRADAD